jgi:molecular chaperone DnaK
VADPIVGIDLGTSNSVVAHCDDTGQARVLADEAGYRVHPSVVSFHPNGGIVVGAAAKQRKVIDPKNTIYSVKRLIGRAFKAPEVQTARARVPFEIKEGANQLPLIVTRAGEFAIPEISAVVLDHVRAVAAKALGMEVNRAVVTVPANFNDAQRSATANAGAIAGITVVRVLNEPTAAALAYGHTRNLRQIIAVYDFGGGTFDVTVLKLQDQVYEVLGTAGDSFLGGDDLDERLVDRMVHKFLTEQRIDLRTNEVAMMRLRAVAEQTKIELSRRAKAVVRVDEIAYGANGNALNLQIEVTREEFVRQVADIIDRTFPVCEEALKIAGVGIDRIEDVVLVGGTTKVPYVRDEVTRFFNRPPRTDVNPEEAVAVGAALQAYSLERILNRRPSTRVPVARAGDEATAVSPASTLPGSGVTGVTAVTSVSAPIAEDTLTFADPPPAPRITRPRSMTERPVTRGATVDRLDGGPTATSTRTRAPSIVDGDGLGLEEKSDPLATPLGRITRPAAPPPLPRTVVGLAPTAGQPNVTARGDGLDEEETTATRPVDALPPLRPQPPASPPPTPATPGSFARPPQPAPSVPPRVPMSAPAERTMLGHQPLDLDALDSPASTAKGIGAFADPSAEPAQRMTSLGFAAASPFAPPGPPGPPGPASTLPEFPTAPPNQPTMIAGLPAMPPGASLATMIAPAAARPAVVVDVTPRGLGIATVAGYCEELIRRNSRVPTELKKVFTTSRDRQDVVQIVVCQGESRRLEQNLVIADLILDNLPPRPRGETQIEVTFAIDASGILNVRARDVLTGKEQRASLDVIGSVPDEDVAASRERMQQLKR